MESKHFAAVKGLCAEVVIRSNRENEVILLTSYPTRRSGSARRCDICRDNSSVGGGDCTDVWRSHNFETLRKTAKHTYALFCLGSHLINRQHRLPSLLTAC